MISVLIPYHFLVLLSQQWFHFKPHLQFTNAIYFQCDVFDAAERYQGEGHTVIILAGKEYGSGSSRDWAAKGPFLLVCQQIFRLFKCLHRLLLEQEITYNKILFWYWYGNKLFFWYVTKLIDSLTPGQQAEHCHPGRHFKKHRKRFFFFSPMVLPYVIAVNNIFYHSQANW